MIDFLVWQGYSKESVDQMTFRQLILFTEIANKRLGDMYARKGQGKGMPS